MPDEPTEVMSLDELMDLAAEPRADTATMPIRTPLPARPPLPTTPAAPRPLNPAAARPAPKPPVPPTTGPDLRDQVLADARRAYEAALDRGREWLKRGDNGLIAATAMVTLLLIVVVTSL